MEFEDGVRNKFSSVEHPIISATLSPNSSSSFDNRNLNILRQDKMRIGRADPIRSLNGDNLRIYRAYLRISDHCGVTVRVRVSVRVGVGVADCCIGIQTAG